MAKEIIIDAFKPGVYPQGEFTMEQLNEVAASYNPAVYEAPILIGHMSDPAYKGKTTIPAFGWIGRAIVVGESLKLGVTQFSQQLKEWYKDGLYKKVSVAFFPPDDKTNPTPGKWHLHHLAFLGAAPPAVAGLEGIAFSADTNQSQILEFAEMDAMMSETDKIEKAFTADTVKDCTESCATFIAKLQDALEADIDCETQKNRIYLAMSDLDNELFSSIGMHFTSMKKIEGMEEKTEMSARVGKIKEFFKQLISGKESEAVDQKKEKEYVDKIAELEAKLSEFAAKQEAEDAARAKAEGEAEDAKLRATITEFCAKSGKSTTAIEEAGIPAKMFSMAKALKVTEFSGESESSKVVADTFTLALSGIPGVQTGESTEFSAQTSETEDKRPSLVVSAEKYVDEHKQEFSGLTREQATGRAIYLESTGEIHF